MTTLINPKLSTTIKEPFVSLSLCRINVSTDQILFKFFKRFYWGLLQKLHNFVRYYVASLKNSGPL